MNLLGRKKYWWLGISAGLIGFSILALVIWPLRIGLDFTGGTLLEVTADEGRPDREKVVSELSQIGIEQLTSQEAGEKGLLLKAAPISQEQHSRLSTKLTELGLTERRFENVGPTVGADLTRKAIVAVLVASFAIICFIAYSFRNVPRPASSWRFGVVAVAALIHDVLITAGGFALLGQLYGYEVDSLFVTALLTIMGFSVHDTIVVFDRLRENMRLSPISTINQFEAAANASLVQTLNRSLNTSITVILVLLSLSLLGGETTRPFIVALLIGITVGTYSSIGLATPLLVLWQGMKTKR